MTKPYPDEVLDESWDNGTMVDSKTNLEKALVGHRILEARRVEYTGTNREYGWQETREGLMFILDDGTKVFAAESGDCCAYTNASNLLKHIDQVNHVITGVGTEGEYTKWHIYAELGDVYEFDVGWSCGNPFYYGYGFDVEVIPADEVIQLSQIRVLTQK